MKMDRSWLSDSLDLISNQEKACLLLSNDYSDSYGKFHWMLGLGSKQVFNSPEELNAFSGLAFGHIKYSFKSQDYYRAFRNSTLHSSQNNCDDISKEQSFFHAPVNKDADNSNFGFFEPNSWVAQPREGDLMFGGDWVQFSDWEYARTSIPRKSKFHNLEVSQLKKSKKTWSWDAQITEEQYIQTVNQIREHIRQGHFYEMNFCVSFERNQSLNPYLLFYLLNEVSPSPFSALYKFDDQIVLCASPERFLVKRGDELISQPIKGTLKRNSNTDEADVLRLKNSVKDRAENVMIVDLVRNDLSRICEVGSVVVPELCGIHSFSHVHQMISTIKGKLKPQVGFHDILEALFPMGSMTGAPKLEVMKYIDALESFERTYYSGSLGYFWKGDFDLNVVIRSIQYDVQQEKITYCVGGAITYDSVAEQEFQECITKAAAIAETLSFELISDALNGKDESIV